MARVQRVIVPETQGRSWIVLGATGQPVSVLNEYLLYLHHLGRSPNTIKAYAHHLQAFWTFLEHARAVWTSLTLKELATFVSWLRQTSKTPSRMRSESTINTVLAAVGSFYEYQDRLGIVTNISSSRRPGARRPYKPFLHHISRNRSVQRGLIRVRAVKRLPKVFSTREVKALLGCCIRRRDRLLVALLYESGMRIGQALGLRHADVRSYDGEIDIVPRSNINGARTKSLRPYTLHVSKELMGLYADYLVHECREVVHDYVFANWWGGEIGKPMTYAAVADLFRRLSATTGIHARPHMFRHTHATELLRAGWNAAYVQRRLGHAQIQTTINTYAHLSDEDLGAAFRAYSSRGAKRE
jgi:integrase/recombinase XerD